MKPVKTLIFLGLALLGGFAGSASAHGYGYYHGPRAHIGVVIGVPAYYYPRPYYYYPPYAYYPYYPPVAATPPVYVERGDAAPAPAQPQDYWYYCPASKAYYPYVKECSGEWQRVAPQPQG